MNKSTLTQIKDHLNECKDDFTPKLQSYIDLEEYSKKIWLNAIKFEKFNIKSNKLIGLIAAYDVTDESYGYITNVSVKKENQRNGIALSLLNKCIKYFKNKGYNRIDLEVYKNNKKAISFYKKNNFKISSNNNKTIIMSIKLERDYNKEFRDTQDHKYAYNFDFDVMHPYMIKALKPHFVEGNCLELGSFKGDFTKRLLNEKFNHITCIEASDKAIKEAQKAIGNKVEYICETFESATLNTKYDNIVITHVLEHIDNPIALLQKINHEWLSEKGKLFIVCPNANAPSRQIAVKMGLLSHNTTITPAEKEHGHNITYTLDVLESHAKQAKLDVTVRSGIFFKSLANFQWDMLLKTDIISKEYLDGCYELGQIYPDLCSSIMLVCKKG